MKKLWSFFCSVKLAVIVLTSLAASLAAATFLESLYDTAHAQYFVYRAKWFHLLLVFLGVNIFCVAMSRWPWKKRHIPFLTAHLGILLLLAGSWVTDRFGVDASLRVSEGEAAAVLQQDQYMFSVQDGEKVKTVSIPWIPPTQNFRSIPLPIEGWQADRYIAHADPIIEFGVPSNVSESAMKWARAAAWVRIDLPEMGFFKEFWVWAGDPSWANTQAGPISVRIFNPEERQGFELFEKAPQASATRLDLIPEGNGKLRYRTLSRAGESSTGVVDQFPATLKTRWKGPMGSVKLQVLKWVPKALNLTKYKPARTQYGMDAPFPAVRISRSGEQAIWLSLGERAQWSEGDRTTYFAFHHRSLLMPFGIKLERFEIEHYQGTRNPAAYWSQVRVIDEKAPSHSIKISMNEPLEWRGYTFYQSSFEPGQPRPVTSIFSVNHDPGRALKYWGSLLLVLGSISLFAVKYWQARKSKPVQSG